MADALFAFIKTLDIKNTGQLSAQAVVLPFFAPVANA
jgi:hypothetical protein